MRSEMSGVGQLQWGWEGYAARSKKARKDHPTEFAIVIAEARRMGQELGRKPSEGEVRQMLGVRCDEAAMTVSASFGGPAPEWRPLPVVLDGQPEYASQLALNRSFLRHVGRLVFGAVEAQVNHDGED